MWYDITWLTDKALLFHSVIPWKEKAFPKPQRQQRSNQKAAGEKFSSFTCGGQTMKQLQSLPALGYLIKKKNQNTF